ncbi:MAG: hypothetical protein BWY09_01813 [Candidatus Hydrogenedentes bacterium ADurb.Bin179]|nr:MAG: hypothetical protein BWY09_01813 [Candidatus Hydrogenedentes bacterium ADurb.Bin179]
MTEQLELFPIETGPLDRMLDVLSSGRASCQTGGEEDICPGPIFQAEPVADVIQDMKDLAETLHRELEVAAGCRISLVITNNTSNMMSIRLDREAGRVCLRLHHMFLDAPEEVRSALAYMVKHPRTRKYAGRIRNYISSRKHQISPASKVPVKLQPQGAVYDLHSIYDELNAACFDGKVDAAITWGRDSVSTGRSIRFGSYYEATNLIRIHRRLDQHFVPYFVVRYIVYHEMLHASLGVGKVENGRRQIHSGAFKKIEKMYPEYQQAVAWIENRDNLNRILGGRRKKSRSS